MEVCVDGCVCVDEYPGTGVVVVYDYGYTAGVVLLCAAYGCEAALSGGDGVCGECATDGSEDA